jgi:hypothetical protein
MVSSMADASAVKVCLFLFTPARADSPIETATRLTLFRRAIQTYA